MRFRSESSRFVDGILLQAREVEGELSTTFFHSDRGGATLALPHVISRSAHVHVSSKWTYGLARCGLSSDFSIFRKPPLAIRNGESRSCGIPLFCLSFFLSTRLLQYSEISRKYRERIYIYIYGIEG